MFAVATDMIASEADGTADVAALSKRCYLFCRFWYSGHLWVRELVRGLCGPEYSSLPALRVRVIAPNILCLVELRVAHRSIHMEYASITWYRNSYLSMRVGIILQRHRQGETQGGSSGFGTSNRHKQINKYNNGTPLRSCTLT